MNEEWMNEDRRDLRVGKWFKKGKKVEIFVVCLGVIEWDSGSGRGFILRGRGRRASEGF